jgi:hypothetical protein
MNLNLIFETILVLFAIFTSNGIIYSLTFFNLNDKNYSENKSLIRNNSSKDGLALTSLIASNPINIISSESSTSNTLSLTSSDSNISDTLSLTSSNSSTSDTGSGSLFESSTSDNLSLTSLDSNGSNEINNIENLVDETLYTSEDSITVLNSQSFEQWWDLAMTLQEFPLNTPIGILHTLKFEELKILYSQDLIELGVTHTELRLIIEHFPAISLFAPDINHLILTIMSMYHF